MVWSLEIVFNWGGRGEAEGLKSFKNGDIEEVSSATEKAGVKRMANLF